MTDATDTVAAAPGSLAKGWAEAAPSWRRGGVTTDTHQNKAVVRRFVDEVRNQARLEVIDEIVAPALRAEFRSLGAALHRAFESYRVEIDDLIAEGEMVVLRGTQSGRHIGPWSGIPPTGRNVRWSFIRVFRVVQGQISATWFASDHASLLEQTGMAVVPVQRPEG